MIICKSASEIEVMKEAGRIVAEVLLKIENILEPGITTEEIDRTIEKDIRKAGAIPAFKGYAGRLSSRCYPSSLCISINEEVVHGIPGKKKVSIGDLVAVDVGVKKNGFFGDAARSYKIGRVSKTAERLCQSCQRSKPPVVGLLPMWKESVFGKLKCVTPICVGRYRWMILSSFLVAKSVK